MQLKRNQAMPTKTIDEIKKRKFNVNVKTTYKFKYTNTKNVNGNCYLYGSPIDPPDEDPRQMTIFDDILKKP